MLSIKFRPTGKKHQRYFRVVVAEKKSKLTGRNTDDLGWVNPHNDTYELKKEKAEEWLKKGAEPTDVVHNLLVRAGIIKGSKIPVHSKSKKPAAEAKTAPTVPEIKSAATEEAQLASKPENKKEEEKEKKEEPAEVALLTPPVLEKQEAREEKEEEKKTAE